jgi:hypothetical protein
MLQRLGCVRCHVAVKVILQSQAEPISGMLFVIDDENSGWIDHGSGAK